MVVYICQNCKKEFNKKSNYLNHIENKKKPCTQLKLKMHQNAPKCTKKAPKCTGKNSIFDIDDNEKEHKLNQKDLCYMLQYIYENVISFKSQMTNNEIKMLITYLNINTDENINNNKYNLDTIQSNIKWLLSITETDERIKQILEDLELY